MPGQRRGQDLTTGGAAGGDARSEALRRGGRPGHSREGGQRGEAAVCRHQCGGETRVCHMVLQR